MKLIIDISDEVYKASQIFDVKYEDVIQIPLENIKNGKPLYDELQEIKQEIEKIGYEPVEYGNDSSIDCTLKIIDTHISAMFTGAGSKRESSTENIAEQIKNWEARANDLTNKEAAKILKRLYVLDGDQNVLGIKEGDLLFGDDVETALHKAIQLLEKE